MLCLCLRREQMIVKLSLILIILILVSVIILILILISIWMWIWGYLTPNRDWPYALLMLASRTIGNICVDISAYLGISGDIWRQIGTDPMLCSCLRREQLGILGDSWGYLGILDAKWGLTLCFAYACVENNWEYWPNRDWPYAYACVESNWEYWGIFWDIWGDLTPNRDWPYALRMLASRTIGNIFVDISVYFGISGHIWR